jgi:hypothetical protein
VIDIFFYHLPLHREKLSMFMYYPAGVISFLALFHLAINIIPRWGIYYSLLFMYYPAGVISFIVLFRFAINIIPRWGIYYSCFEFNPLKMSPRWGFLLFHTCSILPKLRPDGPEY